MHKIILIGWGVMLAAFIYSTRELQCGKGSIVVTSSSHPSILSNKQQSKASLHTRGPYESASSSKELGSSCDLQRSNFFGLVKYADDDQTSLTVQKKASQLQYGLQSCYASSRFPKKN